MTRLVPLAFLLLAFWIVSRGGRGGFLGGLSMNGDVDLLARTIWGEARGEGRAGMEAVAAVVLNRMADSRYPATVAGVVKQPWQFSAWNDGDPNRARVLAVTDADPTFRLALGIARQALSGGLRDPTGGATHYYASYIAAPYWTAGADLSAEIGTHRFFRGVA